MAFLTIAELKTHLYEEIQQEVVRADNDIIQAAIDTAIDEVKGYLSGYDLETIFNPADPADRNKKLLSVTKDIAAWELLKLCNPNIEIEFRKQLYEFALAWLKLVQMGRVTPALPRPEDDPNNPYDGTINWSSNNKRRNQF